MTLLPSTMSDRYFFSKRLPNCIARRSTSIDGPTAQDWESQDWESGIMDRCGRLFINLHALEQLPSRRRAFLTQRDFFDHPKPLLFKFRTPEIPPHVTSCCFLSIYTIWNDIWLLGLAMTCLEDMVLYVILLIYMTMTSIFEI